MIYDSRLSSGCWAPLAWPLHSAPSSRMGQPQMQTDMWRFSKFDWTHGPWTWCCRTRWRSVNLDWHQSDLARLCILNHLKFPELPEIHWFLRYCWSLPSPRLPRRKICGRLWGQASQSKGSRCGSSRAPAQCKRIQFRLMHLWSTGNLDSRWHRMIQTLSQLYSHRHSSVLLGYKFCG